jgi:hypothetical protein
MKYIWILALSIFAMPACGFDANKKEGSSEPKKYTRFNGNYSKTFNDLPHLHTEAATINGVGPLEARSDTALYMDKLVKIPGELEIYRVDKLTHSMPYLVPQAAALLSDICLNFRDSLVSKKKPLYRPIVTSILRTNEDVKGLSQKNRNASDNSVHRYGTTFDIAWTRFDRTDPADERTLDDGKLKAVLGQVLHDLRERDRCYIKHERKQSCFHITVR